MEIEIKGKDLETMPEYVCIIAALVKRLGGSVQLTNDEIKIISENDNYFFVSIKTQITQFLKYLADTYYFDINFIIPHSL